MSRGVAYVNKVAKPSPSAWLFHRHRLFLLRFVLICPHSAHLTQTLPSPAPRPMHPDHIPKRTHHPASLSHPGARPTRTARARYPPLTARFTPGLGGMGLTRFPPLTTWFTSVLGGMGSTHLAPAAAAQLVSRAPQSRPCSPARDDDSSELERLQTSPPQRRGCCVPAVYGQASRLAGLAA